MYTDSLYQLVLVISRSYFSWYSIEHITPALEFNEFSDLLFCFSVSGGELFERVADADCLTEKEASFYMYQLLQGLQYMHNKNIVHLDLKVTKSSDKYLNLFRAFELFLSVTFRMVQWVIASDFQPGNRKFLVARFSVDICNVKYCFLIKISSRRCLPNR